MAAIVHSQMLKLYAGPRSISGSFGASPSQAVVTAYLSQPSCVLSANAEGVVEDYAPASTTIVVEVSGRTDTGNWTLSTAKSPSVGTVSVVGATISVSGMTDDAGWVDITASKAGYESVTRRFTLAKVRQKGGVRVATTLPANPSEVGGELAIFLDVADTALRGMYGWSGTAWVKTGELLNGSVTADKLASDAIQATKFADGIEPVSIVSLLPNVVDYTGPKLVLLTTDNKLYRYTGSNWVKELPAEDLTGQLVADQLASNSVTTGKIQAGAVGTDQLAAKAVTATKMVLTDTSNVYPDYDILDSAFYSGGDFTRVASASLTSGAYALRVAASAYTVRIESQWFQVEPSADYFVEVSASQSISGATGAAAVYVEFASHDGGAAAPTLTRAEQVVRRVSTTSAARADLAVTTTSNERRARLVFIREAGGTGVAEFGGPVIRRRNNAKLIVDGSIVATKIATDAVQTHHLLAGAVTAEKLTVNKLSAITADMGDVTAGTFTLSSTGYIRGGATNFSTGAGFWMGYDAGTYKLRAGTPGSSGFEWTGSAFNVRGPDGSITISSGVVDWGKISGAGKPESGATVGADSSNLRAGPGVNMVFNGDYTDGLAGTTVGWRSGGNQHTLSRNLSSYIVQGEGTAVIHQPGSNGTAFFDANIWNGQEWQFFAVTPGQRYEVYAYLNTHRCVGRVIVIFYDAAGNWAGDITGSEVGYQSTINTISDMRLSHGFGVAPGNAAKALVIIRGYGIDSYDPHVFFSRVYFGMAHAGQTEASPWSPGRGISQITSSNVTTYIDNAAIGNAQIGNAAINTAQINDAAITTAKIGLAQVNTLQIAGDAVVVPRYVESSATVTLATNNIWYTVLSYDNFPASNAPVSITISVETSSRRMRILRSGAVLEELTFPTASDGSGLIGRLTLTYYDPTPGALPTYQLEVYKGTAGFLSSSYGFFRSMSFFAMKR
jgi:hypothetical protein